MTVEDGLIFIVVIAYVEFVFNHSALDEMGSRIDELEQSINNLKAEMGTDGVSEAKPEDPKPADESS